MNILDFKEKRIWVTGAGRGIGREVAEQLSSLGADVIGFDLHFPEARYPYTCINLDVSNEADVSACVADTLTNYGELNILINAAGTLKLASLEETSWDDMLHCFSVNTGGAFSMMKNTAHIFKAQRSGVIVNVSSNAAKVPRVNMAAYCASKAALSALSHTVALELAPYGVRCNVVCPGSTNTQMQHMLWKDDDAEQKTIKGFPEQYKLGIPLGKIAKPSEVAQTIIFFASPMSSHITIQDIVVDGGASLNV